VAVAVTLLLAGCGVQTRVDITARSNGSGVVVVLVTLDRSATAAVGDVAGQLRSADLGRAGWSVHTTAGTSGSTVIRASHAYATPAQAAALVADIAGTGPASRRPFRLALTRSTDWWRSTTEVRGVADLRCGLDCFGDAGLTTALGQATGVSPGAPSAQRRDFTFALQLTLPGTVGPTDATLRSGHSLLWTPVLGQRTLLLATTASLEVGHVAITAVAAVVVVLVMPVVLFLVVRHRWRRPRPGAHRRGGPPPTTDPPGVGEAVTPAP
jgi:hypothetical protein